jgi:hypothetical protein
MIRWFLGRQLAAFQKKWGYDVGYAREVLDADPMAIAAFSMIGAMSGYRKSVPPAPYHAVRLVSVMAEDCGPCSQLCVDMALADGVEPAVLKAVIDRDFVAMPEDVALAVRFAVASLAHGPEAEEPREEILTRWGRVGLTSLAFAMASARIYPTVKYALGHGRACMRLSIAGESRPAPRTLRAAA